MIARFRSLLAAALAALVAGTAPAADVIWTTPATGATANFSTAGNWSALPLSSGSPVDNFIFNTGNATGAFTLTNDLAPTGAFNANAFTFNNFSNTTFTVTNAAGNSFNFAGTTPTINMNNVGSTSFGVGGSNVSLGVPTTVTTSNAALGLGTVNFAGAIAGGTNSLTIGNGSLNPTHNTRAVALNATGTWTGATGVILDGGTFRYNATIVGILGGAANVFTVSPNGGVLQVNATVTPTVGTIAINGPLTQYSTSTMTLATGTLITGSGSLTFRGTTGMVIQSNSVGYTGVVSSTRANTANFIGSAGPITLSGLNGALPGVLTYNIANNATLTLTSNAASTTNAARVNDSADINLRTGNYSLTGISIGGALTETVDNFTVAGHSIITSTTGTTAGVTTTAATSIARVENGTVLFRGLNLGLTGSTGRVTFTTAPSGEVGTTASGVAPGTTTNLRILPYALADIAAAGTGTAFAVRGDLGIRTLATAEHTTSFTGTDNNVRISAANAQTGTFDMNSLTLVTGATFSGTGTLNVAGGVLFTAAIALPHNVNFIGEGIIHNTAAVTYAGNLTGSGGLTKGGPSALTLTGDNSGLTDTLTINGNGGILFNSLLALPGTGAIVINGGNGVAGGLAGGLRYTGAAPVVMSRDLNFNGAWSNISSSGGSLTLSGTITGTSGLLIDTIGEVILTGTNSGWSGPIHVINGQVRISTDANLGTGSFNFGNGSNNGITLDGDWTTSRHINTSMNADIITLNTQGFNAIWNGPFTNLAGNSVATTSSSSFRKGGTGTLTVNAAGTFGTGTYGVIINSGGGEIRFAQNGQWLANAYTVNTGGRLVLDNAMLPAGTASGAVTVNRIIDNASITLAAGGTLTQIGNSSQAVTEVLASLTTSSTGNILQVQASGGFESILRIGNLVAGGAIVVRGNDLGSASLSGSIARVFLTQFNSVAVTDGQLLGNVMWEDLNAPGTPIQAQYSATRGIIAFAPILDSGTSINNLAPEFTSLIAAYTTTGNATATTGAQIFSLTLDGGSTLTLNVGNIAQPGNNMTPEGTLSITGGLITSQNGPKSIIFGGATRIVAFGATANITTTSDLTFGLDVFTSGSGGLIKNGAATLNFNTYGITGPITVNNGAVNILSLDITVTGLTGSPGTALTISAGSLTVNSAVNTTFAGTLTTAFNLTKSGVGRLTVSSPAFYPGATNITGGAIVVGTTNALPTTTIMTIGNPAAGSIDSQLDLNGNDQTVAGLIIPARGSASVAIVTGAGTLTVNGNIFYTNNTASAGNGFTGTIGGTTLNLGGAVRDITVASQNNAASNDLTISAVIANGGIIYTGNLSTFNAAVTSMLLNSSTPNTYALGTTVNAGTINVAAASSLGTGGLTLNTAGAASAVTINSSQTIASLATGTLGAGTATVNVAGTGSVLTVNQTTSTTFNGVITGGGLTKSLSGVLILGGVNTYTGATTITGGVLQVNGSLAAGSAVTVTVGTLRGAGNGLTTGRVAGSISVGAGTIAGGDGMAGTLSIGGGLDLSSSSNVGIDITDGSTPGTLGGSTIGAVPTPTSNTYINKTGGLSPTGLDLATYVVDLNSITFNNESVYSYTIAGGMGDQSMLSVTALSQFVFVNVSPTVTAINTPMVTGDAGGFVYLTFTPVPEPALLFAIGLGLAALRRRK